MTLITPVVQRWIAYRTGTGYGRAATRPTPLDKIRPNRWEDDWNVELLEVLTVLTLTVEHFEEQVLLLDEICQGPLIDVDKLPAPEAHERKEPKPEMIEVTLPGMRTSDQETACIDDMKNERDKEKDPRLMKE